MEGIIYKARGEDFAMLQRGLAEMRDKGFIYRIQDWPHKGEAYQFLWGNKPDKAAKLYKIILKKQPDSTHLRLQLAKALLWSNQNRSAEKELEFILYNAPENKEALV